MPKTRGLQRKNDEENEFGHGLLHKAVIHNNVNDFKTLLGNGFDLNQRDELGFSPLHLAALLGRNEIIHEMIRIRDGEISTEGTTSRKKGLDSLSKRGSESNLESINGDRMAANGQTPLTLCIKSGHDDTLSLLLQLGCHMKTSDSCRKFTVRHEELLGRSRPVRVQKEKAFAMSAKYSRKIDIGLQDRAKGITKFVNSPEEFDDMIIIKQTNVNLLPDCRNLGTELTGALHGSDDESASELNIDDREINDENTKPKASKLRQIIDPRLEDDSCKGDLRTNRVENICTCNMASTCHIEEHCKGLEYCSNPHQKLGFIEKGYTINKKILSEGCNDGNSDIHCAAGEFYGIAVSTHAIDISHEMMKNKISNSFSTPEVGNDISRNDDRPMLSKCSNIMLWKGGDLNISKEDKITGVGNLETPFSIGQIRKSVSAPEIGIETDHNSNLVQKTGWHNTQSIEFADNPQIEALHIKRKTRPTDCDNFEASLDELQTFGEKFEETLIFNNADHDSCTSTNQEECTENEKDAPVAAANIGHTNVSESDGEDPNQWEPRGLECLESQNRGSMEVEIEKPSLPDLELDFIDGDCSDQNDAQRANERCESALNASPYLTFQQGTCADESDPGTVITLDNEAESCISFQLSLNGRKVDTDDDFLDTTSSNLNGNDTISKWYDELKSHNSEVNNKPESIAYLGHELCSDCFVKRKIKHIDEANFHLSTEMGASHSNDTTPVNDQWEIWELNNNKNDSRKEWNSPSRTCAKRQQSLSTFPSRSCSLPDLLNTKWDNLAEREFFESSDCFLVDPDTEIKNGSTLRRHSLPELSALPIWQKESCSKQAVGIEKENEYKEFLVSSNRASPIKSIENCFGNKDGNAALFDEAQSSESRSVCGTLSPAGSDQMLHSLSPLISPVHNKPELPYIFCENIYHIRSDSDLRGKYRKKFHPRAVDDDMLSRSTSYLSQCFLEEVVDYFPCKDDSHMSITTKHQCYDWNLCIEPHCESDKNHLTVSMKSKDDNRQDELSYSYICSDDEDLQGSFICLDCGSTVPKISANDNEDHSDEEFVEIGMEPKAKDEFVLICVPNRNDVNAEEIVSNCGSLNVYHREDGARNRRLSGIHGSLENIEETDIEMDYEDINQCASNLLNNDCKLNVNSSDKDCQNDEQNCKEEFGSIGCVTKTNNDQNCHLENEKNMSSDIIDQDKEEMNEHGENQSQIMKFNSNSRKSIEQTALNLPAAENSNSMGDYDRRDCFGSRKGELRISELDSCKNLIEGTSAGPTTNVTNRTIGHTLQGDCINRNADLIIGEDERGNPAVKLGESLSKDNGLVGKDVVSSNEKEERCNFQVDDKNWEEDQRSPRKDWREPRKNPRIDKSLADANTANNRESAEVGNKCETNGCGNPPEGCKRAEAVLNNNEQLDSKEGQVKSRGMDEEEGNGFDKSSLVIVNKMTSTQLKIRGIEEDLGIHPNIKALQEEQTARDLNTGIIDNDCKIEEFYKNKRAPVIDPGKFVHASMPNISTDENSDQPQEAVIASKKGLNFKIRHLHQIEDENSGAVTSTKVEKKSIAEANEELLPSLSIHGGEEHLNFAAIFREMPEVEFSDCIKRRSRVAVHKGIVYKDCVKELAQGDSQTCDVEMRSNNENTSSYMKNTGKFSVGSGNKGNELKKSENISRGYSKCKLNFSTSESENLEHAFRDCSCCAEGSSYGCLMCSCERGISQSTSESLISADTGIDVDDVCSTDWDEFNQCLDLGSSAGEICACGKKQRLSSTPISRKVTSDCSRRELASKDSGQKENVDENTEEEKLAKSPQEQTHKVDYDLIEPSLCEVRESNGISGEEDCMKNGMNLSEQNAMDFGVQSIPNEFSSKDQEVVNLVIANDQHDGQINCANNHRQGVNEHVPHRRLKATEHGRDLIVLLRKMAKKAKHDQQRGVDGFDIKLIANREGNGLHVKLFVLNFKNEEAFVSKCGNQTCGPANARTATLNSALELRMESKKSSNAQSHIVSCVNLCGKGIKVNIDECWCMKSPKILAMFLIALAESSEPLRFKVKLANVLLSNVHSHATCSMSAIINWVLTNLGFIKSESSIDAVSSTSATLILLSKLIIEPYFELKSIRQLAYLTARPRVHVQSDAKARKEFLCACLRIEIRNFAFSCKYAFKIFTSVQMLLCGLGDELKTAFETLDKFMIEYLHNENCLDFISDVLMYLGLLKSEFQVNVTTDYKTCFQLLTHIVKQSYFPIHGAMVIDAFIKKPNRVLDAVQSQKSELELVLLKRIKDSRDIETE